MVYRIRHLMSFVGLTFILLRKGILNVCEKIWTQCSLDTEVVLLKSTPKRGFTMLDMHNFNIH